MMSLSAEVLEALEGKSLATAESITGGGIGSELTAVPGSSKVYKGGIISYTDWVKEQLLGVPAEILERFGAVSEPVAVAMARGARQVFQADAAVSVTGLAGPGGDAFGNQVGTVFIGLATQTGERAQKFRFSGDREAVRQQTIQAALELVLKWTKEERF